MSLIVGGISIWYSGWTYKETNVPNFTAIAMVLLVISQGMMLKAAQKEDKTGF